MVYDDNEPVARSNPGEIIQFRCPVCGQHAPIARITEEGPFEFEIFRKTLGGKRKFTEEERRLRRGQSSGRGSGPGKLEYEPIRMLKKYRDAIAKRLSELLH